MKNFILFLMVLGGAFSFSGHATTTVVAEDTAEHTISFTFGRPSADVYLCEARINTNSGNPTLDTMTFPDGSSIHGDILGPNSQKIFTKETTPSSSTMHLGSPNYGDSIIIMSFCHDIKVPSENPGGQVDSSFKIQTPANWSYFTNAGVIATAYFQCPPYVDYAPFGWFNLASNSASDYTLLAPIPFGVNSPIISDPSSCKTTIIITEDTNKGPRPANEAAGNVTLGVKDVINFN